MPAPTLRVRAVGDARAPYYDERCQPRFWRYCGRGPAPDFAPLPDGEDVPDHAEHRRHLAYGDLELMPAAAPARAPKAKE